MKLDHLRTTAHLMLMVVLGTAVPTLVAAVLATVDGRALDELWAFECGGSAVDPRLWLRGAVLGAAALGLAASALVAVRRLGAMVTGGAFLAIFVAATSSFRFANHGGDDIGTLVAVARSTWSEGNLGIAGETLGHLWVFLAGRTFPQDPELAVFASARAAGWFGAVGLALVAAAAARRARPAPLAVRAGLVAALLAGPMALLLGPYPQSTNLAFGLACLYMGTALWGLETDSTHVRRAVAGLSGGALGLAVMAHGAAYALGLGGVVFFWTLWHRERLAAAALGAAFSVAWAGGQAMERILCHRMWATWRTSEIGCGGGILESVRGNLDGPIFSGDFVRELYLPYWLELATWMLSVAPLAVLAVVARLASRGGAGTPQERATSRFLAASTVGTLIFWSLWDLSFGYPRDWDVTAVAVLALTSWAGWSLASTRRPWAIGLALGAQAWAVAGLSACFLG